MANKTLYVFSTTTFESLKECRDQLLKWQRQRNLKEGTKVFEISTEYEIQPTFNFVKPRKEEHARTKSNR